MYQPELVKPNHVCYICGFHATKKKINWMGVREFTCDYHIANRILRSTVNKKEHLDVTNNDKQEKEHF